MEKVPFSFLGLKHSYDEANYVVVPFPFCRTFSWTGGSDEGPLSIIEASRYLEPYDLELGFCPAEAGIFTMDEIVAPVDLVKAGEVLRATLNKIHLDGKFPILLGGDHILSLFSFTAAFEERGCDVYLSLDAHADLVDSYQSSKYSHACTTARILETFPSVRALIVGVRSMSEEEVLMAEKEGELHIIPVTKLEELRDFLVDIEGRRAHLSIDADFLDPSIVPCVPTPEPGGVGYREAVSLLREITNHLEIISMDVVEFRPCPFTKSDSLTMAALIYKVIGLTQKR